MTRAVTKLRAVAKARERGHKTTASVRKALLRYYQAHARDLPWRRTRDPYAIWVSEVMLQQTRVDTVLRYYEPFLARFATAQALCDASQDDVLSAWSGLGYYRRARLLHAGVREVVARYGGQVPEAPEARRSLPGIGRYTAGAIGSIAFGRSEPIVDGNVARVLSRLHAIDTPLGRADTSARLWELAEELVQGPEPGALNQALMELGALVCTKSQPKCERCPVQMACAAHAQGRVAELPVSRKKTPPVPVALVAIAALAPTQDAVLLVRGEGELFGGLWNLPMTQGEGLADAKRMLAELGVRARFSSMPVAHLQHVLTHRHLSVVVFSAKLAEVPEALHLRVLPRADLRRVGVSSLTMKALAHVLPPTVAERRRKS